MTTRKHAFYGICLLAALTFAAVQAKASLIYDNGPINGTAGKEPVAGPNSISDSFTVTGSASLGSAQVGLWVNHGDLPSTVAWSIGTAPSLSDISSGTSSFMNTLVFNNGSYQIYQSVFNISGAVGSGTYYLTLGNGTTSNNSIFAWDVNFGPSTAYQNPGMFQIPSESFQIFGTVPDAGSSVMLLGIGLAGVGWMRRKLPC